MKASPLLRLLASGEWRSGEELGQSLGISRAAVWKQVQALRDKGWNLQTAAAHGYRLEPPIEWLDEQALAQALAPHGLQVCVHEETASTNADVFAAFSRGQGHALVVLAESQTQGRGRHGRSWYSPYACNFMGSLGWRFEQAASELAGLSLALGVAVAGCVNAILPTRRVGLKWPNDIQIDGCKLGGLLVELAGDASGPSQVVIGLGLNHHLSQDDRQRIDQKVISLADCAVDISRQLLAERLVLALQTACLVFARQGFAAFQADYAALDVLRDQPVQAWRGQERIQGWGRGVSATGALCIESMGQWLEVNSGEVTLRGDPAA